MSVPPICLFTEDTPLLFVRDETTRRLPDQARDVAVEANALVEDCLKAIADNPHRHIRVTHEGAESAPHGQPSDRTLSLPTRWGEVELRIRKQERFFQLMIGSFEAVVPVPWNRVTIAHVRTLLRLVHRAVRSAVLHQEADAAYADMRSMLAALIERRPEISDGYYNAPDPWSEGMFHLRNGSVPFSNAVKIPFDGIQAMEMHLVGGARTTQGPMGPQLRISPLTVRMDRMGHDPLEWMRMVGRGIELLGDPA